MTGNAKKETGIDVSPKILYTPPSLHASWKPTRKDEVIECHMTTKPYAYLLSPSNCIAMFAIVGSRCTPETNLGNWRSKTGHIVVGAAEDGDAH